jgi:Pentapeptide repeats (9 copies)
VLIAADVGSAVSIGTAVVGALVAILGVAGYQNRRARLSAIRAAFNDVVGALASSDARQQLAAAILLRRFFDAKSELGARDLLGRRRAPYSGEALSVMAAVLRGLPSGDLQKLLADGLAYAPTLERADLQRTNLQGAYLGSPLIKGTLERADFYRADLSGGSLKEARTANAFFYQARLRGTVFQKTDLRGASFFEADVTGANFEDAQLKGASFANARGVPAELEPFLDSERRYTSGGPAPPPARERPSPPAVFLSLPSSRTPSQEATCDRLATLLRREGFAVQRLTRNEYPPSDALSEIYRRLTGCAGAVVFGMRPAESAEDESSPGVTPWTHVEAGMAYGCNLALLIVREPGIDSGAFDDSVAGHRTFMLDLVDGWEDDAIVRAIRPWLSELVRS